jgi:hypothetical protein
MVQSSATTPSTEAAPQERRASVRPSRRSLAMTADGGSQVATAALPSPQETLGQVPVAVHAAPGVASTESVVPTAAPSSASSVIPAADSTSAMPPPTTAPKVASAASSTASPVTVSTASIGTAASAASTASSGKASVAPSRDSASSEVEPRQKPAATVAPPNAVVFKFLDKVELAPDYACHGDASRGPLVPGAHGIVVRVADARVQVQKPGSKIEWWCVCAWCVPHAWA